MIDGVYMNDVSGLGAREKMREGYSAKNYRGLREIKALYDRALQL